MKKACNRLCCLFSSGYPDQTQQAGAEQPDGRRDGNNRCIDAETRVPSANETVQDWDIESHAAKDITHPARAAVIRHCQHVPWVGRQCDRVIGGEMYWLP